MNSEYEDNEDSPQLKYLAVANHHSHTADFGKMMNTDEDESLLPGKAALTPKLEVGVRRWLSPLLPAPRDSSQTPPRFHTGVLRRLVKHCGRYRPDL